MAERIWWQKPRLRTNEPGNEPRKVSWLELFCDLVFVLVIAQLAHGLSQHISPVGARDFVILFLPVWWIWATGTFYNEYWETDDISDRVFFFLQMMIVVALAVFAHDALNKSSKGFALTVAAANLLFASAYARVGCYVKEARPHTFGYAAGFALVGAIFGYSAFVGLAGRVSLWGLALVVQMMIPVVVTLNIEPRLPYRREISKLPERFGLFTIVVLGEMVVGVFAGLANHSHGLTAGAASGTLGLCLAFAIWWVYFDFTLGRKIKNGIGWRFLWAYLHLPLVMGIVIIGACLQSVIAHGEAELDPGVRWLFGIGLAVSVTAIAFIEMMFERGEHRRLELRISVLVKLGVATIAIAIAYWGSGLTAPGVLSLLLVAMIVPVTVAIKAWVYERLRTTQ